MKKTFLCVAILAICACESDNENRVNLKEREEIQLTRTEQAMTEAGNVFAFNLFNQVNSNETKDNFFISPLSASIALSMTTNGANSTTLEEMKSTLGFNDYTIDEMNLYYQKLTKGLLNVDPSTELGIANSIWTQQGFPVLQSFADVNKKMYDAEVREIDFDSSDAPNTINQWCANQTNNRIDEVIKQISSNVKLLLINALYFKGTWKFQFDKKQTASLVFTNKNGSKSKVDMMQQECGIPYTSDENIQIAEFPYGNEAFSMVVILPNEDSNVETAATMLTPENWKKWLESMDERNINIQMPRFKIEYERKLNEDLQGMGMVVPFSSRQADFSKMSDRSLFIGFVQQNTFIEVNEQGTEAAAVTTVGMFENSGPGSSIRSFHMNRPFIYLIKEKSTGSILFIGKMESMK